MQLIPRSCGRASSAVPGSSACNGRVCLCGSFGAHCSQPFPCCGSGGERSLSWGAGASPATAHRAAAGPALKVRDSPRASNSPHICLIHTFCLSLLPSLWPSNCPADTCTHPCWLPAASWRWRTHPRPRLASMGRREALRVAQVPVRMAVWGGILVARS